jgi:hypothetical protein
VRHMDWETQGRQVHETECDLENIVASEKDCVGAQFSSADSEKRGSRTPEITPEKTLVQRHHTSE